MVVIRSVSSSSEWCLHVVLQVCLRAPGVPHAVTAVLLRLAARPRLKSVGDGWSRAGRSDVAVELPVLAWRRVHILSLISPSVYILFQG